MITSSKNTINSCRICSSSSFSDLFNVESFPLFYGAITPKKKKDVQQYPLSIAICKEVKSGEFSADMKVSLTNDGPVTLIIDSRNREPIPEYG